MRTFEMGVLSVSEQMEIASRAKTALDHVDRIESRYIVAGKVERLAARSR